MSTQTQKKTINGLNLEQMYQTIEAIKSDPSLAQFNFRASNTWVNGGHNRSTIQGFYGAGQEDTSREQPFVFDNDEPPVLLGNNEGANPVEFLLHAVAGCVTTTFMLHAAARGISVREFSAAIDGDIDLQGLLGLADVPVGYQEIRIRMDVEADCSDEELDDLIQTAKAHSPTCNTVCNAVPVKVTRKQ